MAPKFKKGDSVIHTANGVKGTIVDVVVIPTYVIKWDNAYYSTNCKESDIKHG